VTTQELQDAGDGFSAARERGQNRIWRAAMSGHMDVGQLKRMIAHVDYFLEVKAKIADVDVSLARPMNGLLLNEVTWTIRVRRGSQVGPMVYERETSEGLLLAQIEKMCARVETGGGLDSWCG
jgi:hypothetical protein